MRALSLEISIEGNQYNDPRLDQRTVDEATEVYRVVFEELHRLIGQELGRPMANLAFGFGMDLLPWQIREIVIELVVGRTEWGLAFNQEIQDHKAKRRKLLKRVPLFANLSDEELDRISENLASERVPAGHIIIRQGEPGDRFYIIDKGNVVVWQKGPDEIDERMVQRLGPGQYFGEIALVTDAPRNATVKATTPVYLLSLGKADFDRLIRQQITLAEQVSSDIRYNWLLRAMPIFDELESYEIELLAALLQPETYNKGDIIFREGDSGDRFYIIESGEVVITREIEGKTVEISRRRAGEYLGEIALLQDMPRTATIAAAEKVTLLSLEREFFLKLVSNFMNLRQTVSRTSTRRLSFTHSIS
jgi:CRP-like cAMP-binding protein